jgi:quercetin dioxygenase-like cupin family protein
MRDKTRTLLLTGVVAVALLGAGWLTFESPVQASTESGGQPPLMLTAGELKWVDASAMLRPGAEIAVLYGDPKKAGPFAMRLRFPAGFRMPAHRHPADEHVTVISGTLHLGQGEKPDAAKAKALSAGSFVLVPAGTPHYGWFSEQTVLQLHGTGPWGVAYIDPADAPKGR